MFDFSWGEILLIGVVALVAIGPKELPGVLRTLGQWAGKVRRMAAEFQGQFQEAMREAEFADIKKEVDALTSGVTQELNKPLEQFDQFDSTSSGQVPAPAAAEAAPPAEMVEGAVLPQSAAAEPAASPAPASPEPAPQTAPAVDVPLPEPAAPVTEQDILGGAKEGRRS
jgi:sec-independent protein translocase protein TatB